MGVLCDKAATAAARGHGCYTRSPHYTRPLCCHPPHFASARIARLRHQLRPAAAAADTGPVASRRAHRCTFHRPLCYYLPSRHQGWTAAVAAVVSRRRWGGLRSPHTHCRWRLRRLPAPRVPAAHRICSEPRSYTIAASRAAPWQPRAVVACWRGLKRMAAQERCRSRRGPRCSVRHPHWRRLQSRRSPVYLVEQRHRRGCGA